MSKQRIIFISTAIIILLGVLVYVLFGIKTTNSTNGAKTSVFQSFFPFGGSDNTSFSTTTSNTDSNSTTDTTPVGNFTQKLRKISNNPVAGAGVVDITAGTLVRYIEKATGHIFETELFSPNQKRISNTTIPRVYDAIWLSGGKSLIARYLEDDNQTVDTYSLTLKATSTSSEDTIAGILLSGGITSLDVSGASIFYLQDTGTNSIGTISNINGGAKKQIWNSPIREMIAQYVNSGTVALTTRPEQNVPGFLYFVNTSNGQVKKIMGDIDGLSTLTSPDAKNLLAMSTDSQIQMFLYSVSSGGATLISPTTFPEKCVWSKKDVNIVYCGVPNESLNERSLLSWYMGVSTYTDQIWKYDLKNNTSSVVSNISKEGNTPIDLIKPILSDNERYIVFINKIDNTLWSLDLSQK